MLSDKDYATLRARAALRGYEVYMLDEVGSNPPLFVVRRGRRSYLSSMLALRALLEDVMLRSD